MRHNYLYYTAVILFGIAVLLQSNASGPASNGNRATGAPGDGTACTTCHTGGSFGSVSIDLQTNDDQGNEVTEYIAGGDYDMTITVDHSAGNPSGFGFQMLCLQDSDNSNVPGWSNPSSNAQLSFSAGRNYVEHDGASSTNQFMVEWTAPSAGKGDLTFYLGANAVNLNGANSSDNAALSSVTIAEISGDTNDSIPAGINEEIISQLGLYPNPARNFVQLRGFDEGDLYSIFSATGSLEHQGIYRHGSINIQELPSGYYFIKKEESIRMLPLLKL